MASSFRCPPARRLRQDARTALFFDPFEGGARNLPRACEASRLSAPAGRSHASRAGVPPGTRDCARCAWRVERVVGERHQVVGADVAAGGKRSNARLMVTCSASDRKWGMARPKMVLRSNLRDRLRASGVVAGSFHHHAELLAPYVSAATAEVRRIAAAGRRRHRRSTSSPSGGRRVVVTLERSRRRVRRRQVVPSR